MKNTILTYLTALFLITLTSCQHKEYQSKISSPEDLILGFKFNETSINDIEKRFDIKESPVESYKKWFGTDYSIDGLYEASAKKVNLPNIKTYRLGFENDKLHLIIVEFGLDKYDEILSLCSENQEIHSSKDRNGMNSIKWVHRDELIFAVYKLADTTAVLIAPFEYLVNNKPSISNSVKNKKEVLEFFKKNL